MNYARFQSIYRGLSGTSKRLYDAVPAETAWSTQQILNELSRQNQKMDVHIAVGTLSNLKQSGLVLELGIGMWRREKVNKAPGRPKNEPTPAPVTITNVKEPMNTPATKSHQDVSAIDKFCTLAERVKTIAKSLVELASDIEKAALEIEEQSAEDAEQLEKARKLKQLLQEL